MWWKRHGLRCESGPTKAAWRAALCVAILLTASMLGALRTEAQPAALAPAPDDAARSTRSATTATTTHQDSQNDYRTPAAGETQRRGSTALALADAQAWMLTADSGDDYSTALLSFYLNERFGWRIGALQLFRSAQGILREPAAIDWGPLIGAAYPASPRWSTHDPAYAWIAAAALRCHLDAPPLALDDELNDLLAAGAYSATHAALAWVWMSELRCETALSREQMLTAAREVMEQTHASYDLGLEARAMYALLGGTLDDAEVSEILASQRPGGWWGTVSNRYHATTLAAWTLLMHRGDLHRDVPMTFLVPNAP